MKQTKAIYRCLRCTQLFTNTPGPIECPVCNHEYIKWINYKEKGKEYGLYKLETHTRD